MQAQRESFDVIGKVGFGRDFGASRDIDNTVNNTFRMVTNDFEENMRRSVFPLRRYSRSQVLIIKPSSCYYMFPPAKRQGLQISCG